MVASGNLFLVQGPTSYDHLNTLRAWLRSLPTSNTILTLHASQKLLNHIFATCSTSNCVCNKYFFQRVYCIVYRKVRSQHSTHHFEARCYIIIVSVGGRDSHVKFSCAFRSCNKGNAHVTNIFKNDGNYMPQSETKKLCMQSANVTIERSHRNRTQSYCNRTQSFHVVTQCFLKYFSAMSLALALALALSMPNLPMPVVFYAHLSTWSRRRHALSCGAAAPPTESHRNSSNNSYNTSLQFKMAALKRLWRPKVKA